MRRALLIWLSAVALLSLLPLRFKLSLGTTGHWHSLGHYAAFFVTMLIASLDRPLISIRVQRAVLLILFGVGLELSEVAIYRNSFEWSDVLWDSLGAASVLAISLAFLPRSTLSRESKRL